MPLVQSTFMKKAETGKSKKPKTTKFSDIDLNNWKEYDNVITDSLWLLESRDSSGMHTPEYHGNFIPQIPYQAMLRYTKKNEWVLDTFLGNGTTLIECKRLGRNGIGIELVPEIAKNAEKLILKESNPYDVKIKVIVGDSRSAETIKKAREFLPDRKAQLLIMHPPYWDIIRFSKDSNDLSNAKSLEEFLSMFRDVVKVTYDVLENERFLTLVIGDKYENGEWVPLGFYAMQEILKQGYKLKSIVVKDIQENRGKRNQYHLWRYRALAGGYYIFKHEYVMFFQKS